MTTHVKQEPTATATDSLERLGQYVPPDGTSNGLEDEPEIVRVYEAIGRAAMGFASRGVSIGKEMVKLPFQIYFDALAAGKKFREGKREEGLERTSKVWERYAGVVKGVVGTVIDTESDKLRPGRIFTSPGQIVDKFKEGEFKQAGEQTAETVLDLFIAKGLGRAALGRRARRVRHEPVDPGPTYLWPDAQPRITSGQPLLAPVARQLGAGPAPIPVARQLAAGKKPKGVERVVPPVVKDLPPRSSLANDAAFDAKLNSLVAEARRTTERIAKERGPFKMSLEEVKSATSRFDGDYFPVLKLTTEELIYAQRIAPLLGEGGMAFKGIRPMEMFMVEQALRFREPIDAMPNDQLNEHASEMYSMLTRAGPGEIDMIRSRLVEAIGEQATRPMQTPLEFYAGLPDPFPALRGAREKIIESTLQTKHDPKSFPSGEVPEPFKVIHDQIIFKEGLDRPTLADFALGGRNPLETPLVKIRTQL